MIERDGIKGVTSNPSIFEKAIGESEEYKECAETVPSARPTMASPRSTSIWRLPTFGPPPTCCVRFTTQTKGRDGYISLECSPYLANDTEATIGEALRLWAAVDRPNLMVKVPATPAGTPGNPPTDRPRT